jgi:hypothetical protein
LSIRRYDLALAILLVLAWAPGCAMRERQVERELQSRPAVDCRTARGDLRMLEHDKAHVVQRIAAGATSIFPAGLVLGVVTGTAGVKLRMATGKYNEMIDVRMAEIKRTCGVG